MFLKIRTMEGEWREDEYVQFDGSTVYLNLDNINAIDDSRANASILFISDEKNYLVRWIGEEEKQAVTPCKSLTYNCKTVEIFVHLKEFLRIESILKEVSIQL